MSTVDKRVVQMEFNNQQFEAGVKTSVNSLNTLKNGLNLESSAKSLSNLNQTGKAFSLSGIASGVESLNAKFSALGIMGITVLQNITNSAIQAGKNIVSALTIDPIKTGLDEYETKMNAITTIMTNTKSKGTTLDEVNKALGELNEYADLTIYNFAQMTRNIGTFTAAGVALGPAVTAIKGIANLAAGSGSSAEQASTAMYQLSQALASGTVKLMDWNSVVNAGMGGELFQKALENTAKELGHGRNEAVSFRESLESGWITSEVLIKTLEKLANDVDLTNAATQVKTFTQLMSTMKESVQSGWAVSWENIIGNKEQATKTLTAINDAFGALIGPSTDARNAMLAFWNQNGGRDALIQGLTNAFQALMAILKPIGEAFREIFPAMTGERLVELTKGFKEFTEKLKISDQTTSRIKETFKGFFSILKTIGDAISTVVKGLFSLGSTALPPISNLVLGATSSFGKFLTSISESVKASDIFNKSLEKLKELLAPLPSAFTVFEKLESIFLNLASIIGKAFGFIQRKVSGFFEDFNFDNIFKALNAGAFASIIVLVSKFVWRLIDIFDIFDAGKGVLENLTSILDNVRGCFLAYQTQLQAGALMKIAIAIGLLAASIYVLSGIDPEKMGSSLTAITMLFAELIGIMAIFEKLVMGPGFKAMLILPPMMMAVAAAVLVLSFAMEKLGKLDWDEIGKGLTGVGVIMAELALFMKGASFSPMAVTSSAGILILATALVILASAVKKIGEIDTGVLIKGLSGVAVALAELALFMNLMGNPARMISIGLGITILSAGILILAKAFESMGQLSWEELSKGLVAMGGALLIMVLALNAMPKMSIINSLAVLDMATSLVIVGGALKKVAEMRWDEIVKSLTTIGIAFGIMTIMLKAMKGEMLDATALTIVCVSLMALATALKMLGSMSLIQVGVALLALVGVFTVLGLSALVLGPLVPVILALAIALGIFGIAVLALGAGVLALSAGLAALAVSGVAGATALVAIVTSIVSLIPFMLTKFGEGIVAMAKVIGDNVPVIIEAIMKLIMVLLDTILTNLPKIIEKGVAIVVALVAGVIKSLPLIVQATFDLILAFVNGLANAIRKNTDPMIEAFSNLMSAMIEGGKKVLTAAVPDFVKAGADVVGGFVSGIKSKISEGAKWGANLGSAALDAAKKALDSHSPSKAFEEVGMYAAEGLAGGLKKFTGLVATEAENIGRTAVSALSRAVSGISDSISGDMDVTPTIRPVLDLSDVNKGLNSTFGKNQAINVDEIRSKTATISNMDATRRAGLIQNESKTPVTKSPEASKGGLSVTIEQFINNRTQDVQAFAEELEFYRKQVAIGRGLTNG